MKLSKLFGVLVIGGAMMTTTGCVDDSDERDGPLKSGADASSELDGANSTADAATAPVDSSTEELGPCFCDSEPCCSRDENGVGTVQVGFECCWTTTC